MRTDPRRASALPAVFVLAMLIGALLVASSERVMAVKRQQDLGAAKQQATYAAEAVASMKEVQLANLAATNDLAGLDVQPNPNSGACCFGDCLVRWRVEPVRVANPDGSFTVNPVSDPNALAPTGAGGATYVPNYELYVFRVATEAHYLADPAKPGVRPFRQPSGEAPDGLAYDPADRVCAVQADRVVQLHLDSLFKYAIFYGAEGPTGDLEFWVGTGISVQGAIHSNGAIYIGGHGNGYLTGNYWDACSGGGPVTLGASGAGQINITGIDGIYRMRKVCNELAARTPGHPIAQPIANGATPDPMSVPLAGAPVWSSASQNLNGDDTASTLHSLNGIAFTSANDSRNPAFPAPFGPHVRDRSTGGTVVKTLANIPQLAGRPFEAVKLAPDAQRLYWRSATDHRLTIDTRANPGAAPLYYTDFAGGNYTTTATATDASGNPRTPVFARNLPLFEPVAPAIDPDVWPSDPTQPGYAAPTPAPATALTGSPQFEGFPVGEQRGFYLEVALHGGQKPVPDGAASFVVADGKTGLVIRERPAQKAAYWPAASGLTGRMPDQSLAPWNGESFPAFAGDYAAYMKSQYLVLIGGLDVTDAFFDQIAHASTRDDFICAEDAIVNMREATDMHVFYGLDRANGMPGGSPYSVNLLTLNLRQVQDWLKTTSWASLGGAGASGAPKARDHFTGLIYAHRTRRSLTYHPLLRPTLTLDPWHRPNATYSTAGISGANWPWAVREGDGPIETFHCAIRVRDGASIDWAHNGASPAPLGTSGLTICTPNLCYVQGDFNTATHVDASGKPQLPPCAIFADGITALSNAWRDADHRGVSGSLTAGTPTTYNLSYVINNVPTDDVTALDEGSGAVANVVRFLENWGGRAYTFKGSLVVMNKMRYSFTTLGASPGPTNDYTGFYQPPTRNISFNTDLLSRAGQPPYAPFGVQVIRASSTIIDSD